MLRAAAFLSLVLVVAGAAGAGISGVASVTDGDTLKVGPQRICFHGIAAPAARLGLVGPRSPSRIACASPAGWSSATSAPATGGTDASSRCAASSVRT